MPTCSSTAAAHPLHILARQDLVVRQHCYQGKAWWVVKDPLALSYHRFDEAEYAMLKMLDGRTSVEQIKQAFEHRFAPEEISVAEIMHFVGALHQCGLVVSNRPGQATTLGEQRKKQNRRQLLGKLTNVLCLSFRGFDPDRMLTRLHAWFGWCFSSIGIMAAAILGLFALSLVALQYDTFHAKRATTRADKSPDRGARKRPCSCQIIRATGPNGFSHSEIFFSLCVARQPARR